MLAPQGPEEVGQVVEALRRLDPLLDIRWEPKAVQVTPGSYDVMGHRIDPTYDGRWQIIRHDRAASVATTRDYVLLCTVTVPVRIGRRQILMMQDKGPYAPVGEWLVEYMQTWDAAQRHFAQAMEDLAAEHERAEREPHDSAAVQEGAERIYHQESGPYWMGRGFTPRPLATTVTS